MDVESGDGRLEVEGVDGVLRAHSGDGHVRVRGRFDNLDISTSDGRIEAEALAGSSIGTGWNLSTGDGGVTVMIPENFAADISVHTGDGHITLDIASDGLLTVDAWGIPSYQQNTFPQDAMTAARIFSFQIGLAAPVPEPGSLAILMAGLAGFAPLFCRRRRRA